MKSMILTTESQLPAQLAIVNYQLPQVFGEKYTEAFMTSTVRRYLFDGIRICIDPTGIARIVCSVIKARNVRALHELDDGSISFALFQHVIQLFIL